MKLPTRAPRPLIGRGWAEREPAMKPLRADAAVVVFCRRTGKRMSCWFVVVVLYVASLLLAADRCCLFGRFLLFRESSCAEFCDNPSTN